MSVTNTARLVRIDSEVNKIASEIATLESTLNGLVSRTKNFAHFMHADASGQIEDADKAKWSAKFQDRLTGLQTVLQRLAPLQDIESQRQIGPTEAQAAIDAFISGHEMDLNEYSAQFD